MWSCCCWWWDARRGEVVGGGEWVRRVREGERGARLGRGAWM